MLNKVTTSAVQYLLLAVASVTLMGLSTARQAWVINSWSVKYAHYTFNPIAMTSVLAVPPAGHARSALWLASDALQAGNPALAETLITSQATQGNIFAMYLKADVRLAKGDFAGAVAIWQQARDDVALLQAALQAQDAEHLEDALLAYEAIWTLDSESGTMPLANFLINKKDNSRAENLLRQALATFPNSRYRPNWYIRLGDELRRQKHWDDAIAMYETALLLNPDAWDAHLGLGWSKYERGDGFQAAMSEFKEVINAPESQGNGQFGIAQMMARENRFEEADTWFVQAITFDPDDWQMYVMRGTIALQAEDLELAQAVFQETLNLFPDNALLNFEMAYKYRLYNQPTEAIAAIERALMLTAPPNAYHYTLVRSLPKELFG